MSKESLLQTLFDNDVFYNADSKVSGIARLAIDKGYDSLSPAQKSVIQPYFSKPCEGINDPGGHHNDCKNMLTDDELETAYDNYHHNESLLCESCIEELGFYEHQWEKFSRD